MPDYSKGTIYMLEPTIEYEEGDIYYGSTTQPLYKRFYEHKSLFNHKKSGKSKILFEKYGIENIKIILIEYFSCENKNELEAEEAKYIRENKCVNNNIPGRSKKEYREVNKDNVKEYYENNKEKIKENVKKYYENNLQKKREYDKEYREQNIGERKEYDKAYYKSNRENIKVRNAKYYEKNQEKIREYNREYREINNVKIKEHYEINKEKIKELSKEYYENNKQKRLEYNKNYREANKEKLKEKIKCECGCEVIKRKLKEHQKRKKHNELMNELKFL